VQIRGVTKNVLQIRRNVKIVEGRMLTPGLAEVVVGKNAVKSYSGLTLGNTIRLGTVSWAVVGIFDAGGTSFDSEVWADAKLLGPAYGRGENFFQSVTMRLANPDALQSLRDALTTDPKLNVDVTREVDYYTKQSGRLTTLITVLGGLVAAVMAIGAVFGALNTMYSAVAERGREIGTMRAIGFGGPSVVFSFMIEALLIAFIGGLIGCIAVMPVNGLTTGAMNFQTFSHVAFAFKITPELLTKGIFFALIMGMVGGLLPAIRAAAQPVASALRSL
jgi:putative ABC transport system permease protein